MQSRAVVLALALCVSAVAAFPAASSFYEVRIYSSTATCGDGTTAPTSTSFGSIGTCVASSATRSSMATTDSASGNLLVWSYANSASCTGNSTQTGNYTWNACIGTIKYVLSSQGSSLYGVTSYSDSACATLSSGPQFNLGGCSGQVSVNIGSKLEFCLYESTGCSGSSQCQSLSHGDCADTGSSSSPSSAMYDWNAASSATPAVALTAALVAVAALFNKF